MSKLALLLSIRPRFADLIFAGKKTVELRRTRPRVQQGDLVLVYVSSPVKSLIGAFEVASVIEAEPTVLWSKVEKRCGISSTEFDGYFQGATIGFGIVLKKQWKLAEPLPLGTLREREEGFHAPQTYRYLSPKDLFGLTVPAAGRGRADERMKPKHV